LHNTAKDFVRYIQRFEVAEGLYTDRLTGTDETVGLPSQALVVYATSNALSRVEATKKVVSQVVHDALYTAPSINTELCNAENQDDDDDGDDLPAAGGNGPPFFSLDKEYLTALHNSPVTKLQRLDVDTQEPEFIAQLDQLLHAEKADVIFVIRTPNGYHYVVRTGPFMRAMIKFIASNSEKISNDKNGMNALPGTLQGGRAVILVFAKGDKNYARLPSEIASGVQYIYY
jgi:hypothetical protein